MNQKYNLTKPQIELLSRYSGVKFSLAPINSFYGSSWSQQFGNRERSNVFEGHIKYLDNLKHYLNELVNEIEMQIVTESKDCPPKLLRIGQNLITKIDWIIDNIKELTNPTTSDAKAQDIKARIAMIF